MTVGVTAILLLLTSWLLFFLLVTEIAYSQSNRSFPETTENYAFLVAKKKKAMVWLEKKMEPI